MELNAFEPVLLDRLYDSIEDLTHAAATLTANCILGIQADRKRCRALLEAGTGAATALCPYIGYRKAAALAKKALRTGTPLRKLAQEESGLSAEQLESILDPQNLVCSTHTELSGKSLAG